MSYKYTDDDYCDIYENKICDNCGKCLELDGVDVKAIKIEDIAKNKEENSILVEEFLDDLKASLNEDDLAEIKEENLQLEDIYKKFGSALENNSKDDSDFIEEEGYIDAFDHMEYIEDLADINEADFDEMTEEIYPGVRKYKGKLK